MEEKKGIFDKRRNVRRKVKKLRTIKQILIHNLMT